MYNHWQSEVEPMEGFKFWLENDVIHQNSGISLVVGAAAREQVTNWIALQALSTCRKWCFLVFAESIRGVKMKYIALILFAVRLSLIPTRYWATRECLYMNIVVTQDNRRFWLLFIRPRMAWNRMPGRLRSNTVSGAVKFFTDGKDWASM